jgi:hypothetical protein
LLAVLLFGWRAMLLRRSCASASLNRGTDRCVTSLRVVCGEMVGVGCLTGTACSDEVTCDCCR